MSAYKPRNPYALHPLMKKGAVHQKGKTANRRISRQQIEQDIDSWYQLNQDKEERSSERSSYFKTTFFYQTM
jgi:hypothetical protein